MPLLFIFRCFLLISGVKSLKKVENEQKKLKMAEKKKFGLQHPKAGRNTQLEGVQLWVHF